jgi:phosphoribosylformylglycinamidine (FGAM) synthase PurS component
MNSVKIGKYIQIDADADLATVREMCDRCSRTR